MLGCELVKEQTKVIIFDTMRRIEMKCVTKDSRVGMVVPYYMLQWVSVAIMSVWVS